MTQDEEEAQAVAWAQRMTAETEKADEILNKARQEAAEKKIPIKAYLISIFMEYQRLYNFAKTKFEPGDIDGLIAQFEHWMKTGKVEDIHKIQKDPAYA